MLLRFSVENWMSFRDEATLDLVATREEQHPEHIARIEKYDLKLLPIAAIYGANASGKSNLMKALRFAQDFITDPPKAGARIAVKPFLLDKHCPELPTSFRFEILIRESIYEYSFSATADGVAREELKRINGTREKTLFRRLEGKLDPPGQSPEGSALRFASEGTQGNQLLLTNPVSHRRDEIKSVFEWFDRNLTVILPEEPLRHMQWLTDEDHHIYKWLTTRLRDLGTGIASLSKIEIPPKDVAKREELDKWSATWREGHEEFPRSGGNEKIVVRKERGRIVAWQLVTVHKSEGGEDILFNLADESDGTRRLIDLLSPFKALEELHNSVIVIDELDRSLHTNLTRDLIEHYLARHGNPTTAQLIFTTHDTQLMTQEIFRRDEIWITERDQSGASKLVAFSEFKDVRKDKDIRKSYLQGRLGGVPRIRTTNTLREDETAVR
ncbi:MAG: ATP-binding protein [Terracidiphilus sp.]|jgi:AAA15 family ATPase/GTPase